MVDDLLGTLTLAALILCYVLTVQALTAASLILGRFIIEQARHLAAQLPEPERTPDTALYRLGGPIKKWD